ncbi:MAG: hypothetical protein CBC55_09100 [Gammaproteobacteria bacterium TMED95]|nr:MAG: hypothetical protein CBC55_09100 [Gammaproteobacteria bacterium TMED95]
MKTYKGRYKVKNPAKYDGDHTQVIYRSYWEKFAFMWCEKQSNIKSWSSEETVIPYISAVDNKYHRYFVDLKINTTDGRTILIEIKPKKQTKPPAGKKRTKRFINESLEYVKNQCKWKAAQDYCLDRNWKFQIWTEDTLRSMGMKT